MNPYEHHNRNCASLARSILLLTLLTLLSTTITAQQPTAKLDSVIGAVVAIDSATRSVTIKSDAGAVTSIQTDDHTICLRIPAGEKSLAKANSIKFSEIAVGDRVLGHGTKIDQGLLAQRLVVMPSAEIAKKREHDLEEWRQRGVGGIVRELNAPSGEITIELRGSGAPGRLVLTTANANFRRYVPGSLRFEDAQPSSIREVKPGDQLRALGSKSENHFTSEEIVSGTFKTIGVTVVEIDQQNSELKVVTLDQKKPLTVAINKDSVLHRISPPVAAAIAQKAKGDAAKTGGSPGNIPSASAQKPSGQPVIDVQQMIDTLPAIALSDIKTGDVLAVTGAVEKDESRLAAIKIAAGVDLVLKALAPPPGKPQVVRLSAGLPNVFDFSVIPIN